MALNVSDAQVCVSPVGRPPGYDWYHLVLILRLRDHGKWIACNGDLEVELLNLNDSRVAPLFRDHPIPLRCRSNLCGFEARLVECDQALDRVRDEACQLAEILGLDYEFTSGVSADWYYRGPANERSESKTGPHLKKEKKQNRQQQDCTAENKREDE